MTDVLISEATRAAVAAFVDATIEHEYGRGDPAAARLNAHTALTADFNGNHLHADSQLRLMTRAGLAQRVCQCKQLHPHGCPHGSASGSLWCGRHYESDVPPMAGALLCGTCYCNEG